MTPVFREVVAMSFFVNMLALAVPVFTMQVYNRVVNNNGISTLQGLVVGMFLVLLFDYVLRQARARILQTVALRVDVQLGRRLFRKIMRLPLQNLEAQPTAYWSSLFRDVDVVRNTLSGSTALLAADLPFAILFLILIFVIAAPVAWVLLLMLPIFMFVAWRSANIMSESSGQERKSTQTRDSLVNEMITGRTTIKALALDRSMEPVWEEKHAENIENAITRGTNTDGFSNLGASLGMVTTLLLTTVGALAIIDQNLTIGALIATNMLSGRIVGPLNQLVGTWRMYSGFMQAVDRLGDIFAVNAEREESEVQLDKPKGRITVENAVFAYSEDAAPVVSGITVDIEPGGIHALVGRNGSGKTTLLKIIQGLYHPQKGRVTLDGADMAQFTRSELADWLGYVPQESVLFAGTVRDNITARMPGASDAEVIKAATEAGVHHFIIDLPDGYATEIGEAGSRLSGGQRQRIAIARALVGDPSVVLLDEPSSSLDRHAETELKNTLVEIAKTRTVIMVSHSPTLLSACDYLYALDRGKLALSGPAREVLPRLFGGKMPVKSDNKTAKPDATAQAKPQGKAQAQPQVQTTVQTPDGDPKGPKGPGGGGKPAAKPEKPSAGALGSIFDAAAKPQQVGASAKATPQAQVTATAKPKAQVKATATPRGRAPAQTKSAQGAKAPASAAKANPIAALDPLAALANKAKAAPHEGAPSASVPHRRTGSETVPAHTLGQPQEKPQIKATATPRPKRPQPRATATLKPRTAQPPQPSGTAQTTAPLSASATPIPRGPRLVPGLPDMDKASVKKPIEIDSQKHSNIKVDATLRPTTASILKAWADGNRNLPGVQRPGSPGRGQGARARSMPTLRSKSGPGE